MSFHRVKVPQNRKQSLQNDLNSVDGDVKPQFKHSVNGDVKPQFKQTKQEAHGPRFAHLSNIATAGMQMFPIICAKIQPKGILGFGE